MTFGVRLTANYSSPELRRGSRRANLDVFPYQLWYRVHEGAQVVEIIALLHHRQDPAQLSDRLEPPPDD